MYHNLLPDQLCNVVVRGIAALIGISTPAEPISMKERPEMSFLIIIIQARVQRRYLQVSNIC